MGILREISAKIRSAHLFTIMADESADVSNEDIYMHTMYAYEVVICIRWVDADLQTHEEFTGLKPVARCNAEQIVDVIKVEQTIQIKVLF